MTMYLDATRLTFELESNEITRSRLLINRDHIVTIRSAPRRYKRSSWSKSRRSTSDEWNV